MKKKNKTKQEVGKVVRVWQNHWLLTSPIIGVNCITREEADTQLKYPIVEGQVFYSPDKKVLHKIIFFRHNLLSYVCYQLDHGIWHAIQWRWLIERIRDKNCLERAEALHITAHILNHIQTNKLSHYWGDRLRKAYENLD